MSNFKFPCFDPRHGAWKMFFSVGIPTHDHKSTALTTRQRPDLNFNFYFGKNNFTTFIVAPEGCVQWFTGTSGTLSSFNNGGTSTHLASQDYTICIRLLFLNKTFTKEKER